MLKNYAETTDWLFQQFPSYQAIGAKAYKPSLDNIRLLCTHFGNPQDELTFIHVAGTNGKGSTCSMLASILKESEYKTGLFTSPHISDFRERIRINGTCVSEEFIVRKTNEIKDTQLSFEPSFFEITFLLALLYFKEQRCDVCVIETGLGGRLDATNIITPILSLITNISLEHTQFLGDSLTSIASEKAGIIKADVPVIIGQRQDSVESVFMQRAMENNASISFADDYPDELPTNFPLLGDYQHKNFNLVRKALDQISVRFPLHSKAIELGLKNLAQNSGLAARLQIVEQNPLIIFDVSHNADGIEKTLQAVLKIKKGHLHIVYGTSADKDLDTILALFPLNASYFFTEFKNARSAQLADLKEKTDRFNFKARYFEDAQAALKSSQQVASEEDTILVFGSFFLIADLM